MSWMNIYWVIHYFVEGGQNGNFHLRFRAKLQEVRGDFRFVLTNITFDIFILKALYGSVL